MLYVKLLSFYAHLSFVVVIPRVLDFQIWVEATSYFLWEKIVNVYYGIDIVSEF